MPRINSQEGVVVADHKRRWRPRVARVGAFKERGRVITFRTTRRKGIVGPSWFMEVRWKEYATFERLFLLWRKRSPALIVFNQREARAYINHILVESRSSFTVWFAGVEAIRKVR